MSRYGWSLRLRWRLFGINFRGVKPHRDCGGDGRYCHGNTRPHWDCVNCGDPTCCRGMWIDRGSLRRRLRPLCDDCRYSRSQVGLAKERALKDWNEVTVPVNKAAIVVNRMDEQLPGRARQAIRAFLESGSTRATVPNVDPTSLGAAISTLGLDDELYAEQRNRTTVLRRVAQ